MNLKVYDDIDQGTEEWFAVRRGLVTASVVGQLIEVTSPDPLEATCPECLASPEMSCVSRTRKTPTPIKSIHRGRTEAVAELESRIVPADRETSRGLTLLLVAERISNYTDPTWPSNDMIRGIDDEPLARQKYAETRASVETCGFMVRDLGVGELGFSPDGLVGDDGIIEVKSRRGKKQLATFLDGKLPAENMAQIQAGLLVSGRAWCDYLSYAGGWPMWIERVTPDIKWFEAITQALAQFEENARCMESDYLAAAEGFPMTERIDHNLGLVF